MQIASHSKYLCNHSTWFWCHWVWGCCCKPVPHPPFPPQDARPSRSCTRNFPTCLTQCPRWLQWTTLWSWMVALQGQSLWSTIRGAPIRRPVALEDGARFSWFFLWKKGTLGYYHVFFDCQVRTPISIFFFERQHTGAAEWKAVSISPPFKAVCGTTVKTFFLSLSVPWETSLAPCHGRVYLWWHSRRRLGTGWNCLERLCCFWKSEVWMLAEIHQKVYLP